MHLIIFFVVLIVTTWMYTFFELHLKWALLHSGIQGLRALSSNKHKPGKKQHVVRSLKVLLEGQESRYT